MKRRSIIFSGIPALLFSGLVHAMSQASFPHDCDETTFEIHFQEGFSGEPVELMAGDAIVSQFTVQTRFQTGLARIEILDLCDGEEVMIRIGEEESGSTFRVDATRIFVTVTLQDGVLQIKHTDIRPGYL